jgi:hypothetical protein
MKLILIFFLENFMEIPAPPQANPIYYCETNKIYLKIPMKILSLFSRNVIKILKIKVEKIYLY